MLKTDLIRAAEKSINISKCQNMLFHLTVTQIPYVCRIAMTFTIVRVHHFRQNIIEN